MAVLRGLLALLCVVSSAESQSLKAQSFQRVALASCRLPGVDGEARCGSYEVHVVARYGSHGYSTNFSPCVDQLMADFITRGGVKGLDTSCIDRIPQIPFRLSATQSRSDPAMSNNDETQLRQLENEWLGVYFNGDKAAFELHPESEVVFFLKEPPALFLFVRNDKGQVAQMLTIQDGRVTVGKKIK
jgi:hypothetical protein